MVGIFKQIIVDGDAAIPLETTRRAFRNQEKSKQRSAIVCFFKEIFEKNIRFESPKEG